VNARRTTGANVLDVMEGLRAAERELNEGVLRQRKLQLEQVYDETDYIHSAVGLVTNNILVGGSLTIATLLVFLRSPRSTLVIALAIPTSIIGTFLLLQLMGRSLNVISLAGLAFAVGMLVDNAVVVLENIFRRTQHGEAPFVAAVKGTQEVWGAIVSSTMTTLAVFLPILFVEEEAGQLFRDIALAISCSVGLSMFVSTTVIPPAAARILSHRPRAAPARPRLLPRILDAAGSSFTGFVVRINTFLQKRVLRQVATVAAFVAISALLSAALLPKVEYLPTGNQNLVFGLLLPPPGYNLDQLVTMGAQIERAMQPYWDIDPESPEAQRLQYPAIGDFFYVARGRQVFLGLRAFDPLRAGELERLIGEVSAALPGTFGVAKQTSLFEQGLSGGRKIDIEITGPDLQRLVQLAGMALGKARQAIAGAQVRPVPSLDLNNPEVHVVPRWEKAADMGVNASDLGYVVDTLVDGAYAADYYLGGDKIDLTIIGRSEFAGRLQDLEGMPLSTPSGDLVPLGSVADVALGSGPEQINRRERQRTITIEVSPPAATALEDAMDRIQQQIVTPLLEGGELEGGYSVNLAGTADKLRATWRALRFNVLLALLITYLLLAALFESWLYPFVIILTVPLGMVGGIAGLALLNVFVLQPLDVLTMLGFVILIGTVVNNPILIVHQALNHVREEGMAVKDAILESVRNRMRPIFMTTFTTLFGLLPLVLFPGAGSELYRGLGSVLLGGLAISTLFTLILVPTVFHLAMNARAAVARLLGARSA
ncbi:MAG: efflux RND transporter permease subunit, partial [Planctomycetota bacterium]